jgi:hypothetical protein
MNKISCVVFLTKIQTLGYEEADDDDDDNMNKQ